MINRVKLKSEIKGNHIKVIFGDSRSMPEIGDEQIDLVVTSPPYWTIKDYGVRHQIGSGQTYEEYLIALTKVFMECERVLKPGCRMAIVIGDQFLRASVFGKYQVVPIHADVICGICRSTNFLFMGNIIWNKISTTKTTGGGSWMGSTYYPKDGHVTYEHEYILLFRKPGKWRKPTDKLVVDNSILTKKQRSEWFRGMWKIPGQRQSIHPAAFPLEIPHRLIKMYSFVGELVLDPFAGSCITMQAASDLGRNSIGYEINEEYIMSYIFGPLEPEKKIERRRKKVR